MTADNDPDIVHLNKGASQGDRFPGPLAPASISIDDRDKIRLIDFIGRYTQLLNYYTTDELQQLVKDGDWSFLARDPIFILARIANIDQSKRKEQFSLIHDFYQAPHSTLNDLVYALRLAFEISTDLLQMTNDWITMIAALPYDSAATLADFAHELQNVVKKSLAPELVTTRAYALFYEKYALLPRYRYFDTKMLASFNPDYWGDIHDDSEIESFKTKLIRQFYNEQAKPQYILRNTVNNNALGTILESIQNILYTHSYITNLAKTAFGQILEDRDDIKPDIALLLVFCDLFAEAQQKLNNLSGKHLDFYYRDVLRFSEAPLVPDWTVIICQLAKECSGLLLPAGTAFDAGKDPKGNTIEFSSIEDTELNQAKVADVRTVFVASNPLVQPRNSEADITGIYSQVYDPKAIDPAVGFPVVGEDQQMYSTRERTMQDSAIGFALSSAALFLSSGDRSIVIDIYVTADSYQDKLMAGLANFAKSLNAPADADGLSDIWNRLFADSFSVTATGAKGWIKLDPCTISYIDADQKADPPLGPKLSFSLSLPASAAAITAYVAKVHGPGYDTPYPVLNFVLNQAFPSAYNVLNDLEIVSMEIDVTVRNFKNISCYNQSGPLDISKPFQPLGIQPDRGAYFLIGSREMFIKKLSLIELSIPWQSWPDGGDFGAYYKPYFDTAIDNSVFVLAPSFLKSGKWYTADQAPVAFLDSSHLDATANTPTTILSLPVDDSASCTDLDPAAIAAPMVFDQNSTDGFLKFELTAPAWGFGAGIYKQVLSQVVMDNAKKVIDAPKADPPATLNASLSPMPNPPFTPLAQGLSVTYQAHDEISFVAANKLVTAFTPFYHIDVFSTYALRLKPPVPKPEPGSLANELQSAVTTDGFMRLLPYYSNQANLYIGLDALTAPCSVNLYIQLSKRADLSGAIVPNDLGWSYLSEDKWVDFIPADTVSDLTLGLTRSGIITFHIAEYLAHNTIMPAGLFWIRAQASVGLSSFSDLLSISTQAVQVVYSNPAKTQRDTLVLAPQSIKKSISLIPGLKSVVQPRLSKDGVPAENPKQLYTRVSETLRHKNRAITQWDYERIILQQFPNVYQAKCISSTNMLLHESLAGHAIADPALPGEIKIIVIPTIDKVGVSGSNMLRPAFRPSTLAGIRSYVQSHASPHVTIDVVNPVYEEIKIKCTVKFRGNDVFLIQQLNTDITNFLSPWILGNSGAYDFGGGVQKSSILGFIQRRDYVDFVTGFSIVKTSEIAGRFHFYDSATAPPVTAAAAKATEANTDDKADSDLLYALTASSIFVSAAQHQITPITEVQYIEPRKTAIGEMVIGDDLIILWGDDPKPATGNKKFYVS